MTAAPRVGIPAGTRTVVHLVRHGEVHNPTKVLYGRLPGFRLSERGLADAERAAEYLRDHDVTVVVASPLERAQQTAVPIAAEHGLTVGSDPRLIESTNVFEGTTVEPGPRALRDPRMWRHLYNPLLPSWGEDYAAVAARVLDAVYDARDAAAGHEAVCVSHQLPIWVTRRRVEGLRLWHRPDRRECALGSVTSLIFDGDRFDHLTYAEPSGSGRQATGSVGA